MNGVQLVFNGITTNFCGGGIGNITTTTNGGTTILPNGTNQTVYSSGTTTYIPSSPPFDYDEYQPLSLPTKAEIRKAIKDLDKILGE